MFNAYIPLSFALRRCFMRKIPLLLSICVLGVGALASCRKISGNQLDFYYTSFQVSDGVIQSGHGDVLHILSDTNEFFVTYDGEYGGFTPAVSGGTSPKYMLYIAEECQSIEDDLLGLAIAGNENSVIYTEGCLWNGYVYGICNIYKDTVGYFSAGGNYGVEEISHSVYYRYNVALDEFSVLSQINGVMMVAFSGDNVVYWKNEKLYALDIASGEEKFICEDYSYDRGLQHQSRGVVYFNEEYALFYFAKAKGASEAYYAYIYTFDTGEVTKLTYKE